MLQGKAKNEINNLLEDDKISPEEAAFLTGYLEYWFQNNFKQKKNTRGYAKNLLLLV